MDSAETEKLLLLLEQCYPNSFSKKNKAKRYAVIMVLESYSYDTAKKAVLEYVRTRPEFVPTPPELAAICNRYEPLQAAAPAEEPVYTASDTPQYIGGLYRMAVEYGLDVDGKHNWLKRKAEELGVAEIQK